MISVYVFQSTHPRGVRRGNVISLYRKLEFQSTHPRGVRQKFYEKLKDKFHVSIHAPTRGATNDKVISDEEYEFQSTHPRGVRRFGVSKESLIDKFQSTHPRGVRRLRVSECLSLAIVSIHAPTRGATKFIQFRPSDLMVSIHAPTRGATTTPIRCFRYIRVSIHAPTRGATP